MAYQLNGSNNESDGFTAAIASFALRAVHESCGCVNMTNVVRPQQGNQYIIPNFAPITYADYNPAGTGGTWGTGDAVVQTPDLSKNTITATPAVATTAFDIFYGLTAAFDLAAALGSELGESFAEKVDQRVAKAFLDYKDSPGHAMYVDQADGFARVKELGAMELVPAGATPNGATAGFTATTVLELVRNIKQAWKTARLPGAPVIMIDSNGQDGVLGSTLNRLLSELTGSASSQSGGANLSALGNELLSTGKIENIYGCMVMATTFLPQATRTVAEVPNKDVLVGAYFGDGSLFTVIKEGLQIKSGEVPGGLRNWLTGLGYFGAGVGDKRRGGAINIQQL